MSDFTDDSPPLNHAYTATKNADAASMAGNYVKAALLFDEAAEKFDEVIETSPQTPARAVLAALASQQRSRAEYFRSDKAKQDVRRNLSQQSHLAAARTSSQGQQTPVAAPSTIASPQVSQYMINTPSGDALNSLVGRASAAFTRSLEQAILVGRSDPSESFYLVSHGKHTVSSPSQGPTDTAERAQAYESAMKAQRVVLEHGLSQLRQELAQREQRINDEHTQEVDRLRAENDQLRIQVSKLKSRWDELKESARKRREGDS